MKENQSEKQNQPNKQTQKSQQELLLRLGMFEQQINQLQQQLQIIEQNIVDSQALSVGLGELSGSIEKEIFSPVGGGIGSLS